MLGLIERHTTDKFNFIDHWTDESLIFDYDHEDSEPIAVEFYLKYEQQTASLPHETFFVEEPVMRINPSDKDFVATIFYMVNCLQERNCQSTDIDHYGRFRYSSSYQYRFDCAEANLVLKYIHELILRWKMSVIPPEKSKVFMSHDIDALDGSWKHIVYYLLKQKRIIAAFKAVGQRIMRLSYYRNISKLLEYHRQYGIKSTFFFIPYKGKGRYGIQNADYNIIEETELINSILSLGHSVGLHKSSKTSSLNDELAILPFDTNYNRYHFLSHQPHEDWDQLEAAGITTDASLGFAEHIGFRNSYGQPFHPYNYKTKQAFRFLEVPLTIMDGTLWNYMKISPDDLARRVINFCEKNKTDCLISVLWHNTSLTDHPYPGLLRGFIEILDYMAESETEFLEIDNISAKY